MKCDNGGYIIESEKYNHNQVGKQARYNTIAKGLRDFAQKLIEKAEELENKTGFNNYLQSFKDRNFISMGFIDPDIKKEADNLVKDKATNKLNARRKQRKGFKFVHTKKRLVALLVATRTIQIFCTFITKTQLLNLTTYQEC